MLEKNVYHDISTLARALDDNQRRALYSSIVSAVKEQGKEDKSASIFRALTRATGIKEDIRIKIVDLVELGVNEFGITFVWKLYEFLCNGEIAQRLGQYFTTNSLADFALSGLDFCPKRILDPMAGHGAFLIAASVRFPRASLTGVDIDNLPLEAASLVLGNKAELHGKDIFSWVQENITKKGFRFDAIIGNPAYVNYQNLGKIGEFGNLGKAYRNYILSVLREVAKERGVDSEISRLLRNWSGYSDLAVYAIVLSWLLLDECGQIAFVTTNHWLERGYGSPVKQFLAEHGTIKAIVSQGNSLWFPNAQIPTNVFIYTKGNPSNRQRALGIPHVGIFERDAEKALFFTEAESFWQMLSSLEKPLKNSRIEVSFKRWAVKTPSSLKAFDEQYTHEGIEIPDHLHAQKLSSFESSGWDVHQGLRTGCNEVFYVSKSSEKNKYIAIFTKNGKKHSKHLDLPSDLVIPTIQKTTSKEPLALSLNNVDTYLLNFENTLLPEDLKETNLTYPPHWRTLWGVEKYREMPYDLAEHIRERQMTPYEGKGPKRAPISELSAVKTNIYSPSPDAKKIPTPPRFWYQIKLQPRHFGQIIIPRVSGGMLRCYLIKEEKQILTDANFVTLVPTKEQINAKHLWVWLNSNTFRLMAEKNGVIMGGGALKLETTIIAKLPIPLQLLKSKSTELDNIAATLGTELSEQKLLMKGEEIDTVLFGKPVAERVKKNLEIISRIKKSGA